MVGILNILELLILKSILKYKMGKRRSNLSKRRSNLSKRRSNLSKRRNKIIRGGSMHFEPSPREEEEQQPQLTLQQQEAEAAVDAAFAREEKAARKEARLALKTKHEQEERFAAIKERNLKVNAAKAVREEERIALKKKYEPDRVEMKEVRFEGDITPDKMKEIINFMVDYIKKQSGYSSDTKRKLHGECTDLLSPLIQ